MKDLIQKFVVLEKEISAERGEFSLFALFLREEAIDRWDVVVSAPWFEADQKTTLDYIAKKLRLRLRAQDLLRISRIILLEPADTSLKAIHQAISVEHGSVEVKDCVFFGLRIKHGYIITSEREAAVNANVT